MPIAVPAGPARPGSRFWVRILRRAFLRSVFPARTSCVPVPVPRPPFRVPFAVHLPFGARKEGTGSGVSRTTVRTWAGLG